MGRALHPKEEAQAAAGGAPRTVSITEMVRALRRKKMLAAVEEGGEARTKLVMQAEQLMPIQRPK
jgi:hypothetical protein